MVIVLVDQLFHLVDGVLAAIGQVLGDIGDLSPDHHAVLIAQVVEVLVVLVMGQPDGVGTQFPDERHILIVHLPADGIAQTLAVLMAGDAVERVRTAIEEEAFLGVYPEAPDAHAGGNGVHHFPALLELHHAGVEVGVFHAVPQVGVCQRHGDVFALGGGHGVALGVIQGDADGALALEAGLHPDVGGVILAQGGRHFHAGVAVVAQCNVIFMDHQQAHVTVDAAVEREIGFLGVNMVVDTVVHLHGQDVLLSQQGGDIGAERGIATVVHADLGVVQDDLCAGVHALELEPHLLADLLKGRSRKTGAVDAGAPPVIVAAVLAVDGVPGVGQVHGSGVPLRADELPVFHQSDNFAHKPSP